jgi:hypothetical protein
LNDHQQSSRDQNPLLSHSIIWRKKANPSPIENENINSSGCLENNDNDNISSSFSSLCSADANIDE